MAEKETVSERLKKWFASQDKLDQAALVTTPIPVVGDVVGAAADAKHLREDPSLTNILFAAAGVLPFVPRGGVTRTAFDRIKEVLKPGEQVVTDLRKVKNTKEREALVAQAKELVKKADEIDIKKYGRKVEQEDLNELRKLVDQAKSAGLRVTETQEVEFLEQIMKIDRTKPKATVTNIATRIPTRAREILKAQEEAKVLEFKNKKQQINENLKKLSRSETEEQRIKRQVDEAMEFLESDPTAQRLASITDEEDLSSFFNVIDITSHASKRPMVEVVFHGTNKDFPEFKLEGVDKLDDGWYGDGVYFTPSKETAEFYAKLHKDKDYYSKSKEGVTSGPNIRPVRIRLKKPLVIDRYDGSARPAFAQVTMRRAMMKEFNMGVEELNEAVDSYTTFTRTSYNSERGSTWQINAGRMLREKGYDGILVKSRQTAEHDTIPVFGHGDVEEIIIFDPRNTRSVFERAEIKEFPKKKE